MTPSPEPHTPRPPACTRTYGPGAARGPDLEVLLTDGLGGFALSSLAGVPTRCYSGLVASAAPPVSRFTHLISPLERLEVPDGPDADGPDTDGPGEARPGEEADLHALEVAPGVFEGRGLDLLAGASVRDLLPEREQFWRGVRVRRRVVMPPGSGAVAYLYEVEARGQVTLTLGGFFVDRDMHAVHARAPELTFEAQGSGVRVHGARETRVSLHWPAGAEPSMITDLALRPFAQRVYYRADEARGETPFETALGCELWRVTLPPGGGSVALVVQAAHPHAAEVGDPWAALAREQARRRELAQAAWAASGVRDDLVATLAVAADAYLVRRGAGQGAAGQGEADRGAGGRSVIAGYPWFADWGRDAMTALAGLTLLTGRPDDARAVLETFLAHGRRGLLPNHFDESGAGAGYNTVDAALWLAVSLERYVEATGDLAFLRSALPALRGLIAAYGRGTDHGIGRDPEDGLLRCGEAGTALTWMDVRIHDWVVTPRAGKPVEIQALWLAALGAETRLSQRLGEAGEFRAWGEQARASFAAKFWGARERVLSAAPRATGLGVGTRSRGMAPPAVLADHLTPAGEADLSVRPNAVIALALPDTPAPDEALRAALAQTEAELLTPLGLHTLSPRDPRYLGDYGGPQLRRDAAYHQGTVWPWPVASYAELLVRWGEVGLARRALAGLSAHVWEAGIGHVSEVFSGDARRPGGCPFQAWSVAELLRAHVLVSRSEAAQAGQRAP